MRQKKPLPKLPNFNKISDIVESSRLSQKEKKQALITFYEKVKAGENGQFDVLTPAQAAAILSKSEKELKELTRANGTHFHETLKACASRYLAVLQKINSYFSPEKEEDEITHRLNRNEVQSWKALSEEDAKKILNMVE